MLGRIKRDQCYSEGEGEMVVGNWKKESDEWNEVLLVRQVV